MPALRLPIPVPSHRRRLVRRAFSASVLLPALASALLAGPARGQQEEGFGVLVVEEQPIEVTALPSRSLEEIERQFERAVAVFSSVDQADSVALFDELVAALQEPAAENPARRRELLLRSLYHRAEAHFNLGERDAAVADLRTALTTQPSFEPDLAQVSPKLADLFRGVQREMTGLVSLRLEPADAEVRVDGVPQPALAGGRPQRLLAGAHTLSVERPGYGAHQETVEVAAGERSDLDVTLERTSATIVVTTAAPGAEVVVDGRAAGVTTVPPPPAAAETATGAEQIPGEPTVAGAGGAASLTVPELSLGTHPIEVRREGFRSYQGEIRIAELTDYRVGPIALEPTGGTVVLRGLPQGATLTVDGKPHPPAGETGPLSLDLPVGPHRVNVDRGGLGGFERSFDLADRQVVEVDVTLRPKLCLLGVLGGDFDAAERLRAGLLGSFREAGEWLALDRAEAAAPALAAAALTAAGMRGAVATGTVGGATDWAELQLRADRELTCSAYALGVLSDDLYASAADLWVLAAAPGPSRPEILHLGLDDRAAYAALASRFAERSPLSGPSIGAELLPAAGEGAVVWRLTSGGPAAAAGLRAGDVVLAPLDRSGALALPAAGEMVTLRVSRDGTAVEIPVKVGSSPQVLDPRLPGNLVPAVSAWWSLALEDAAAPAPGWVVELNRAAAEIGLGDWRSAVRTLRGIRAPERAGLGRGTVDYWLGVALLAVDPSAYRGEAQAAFERAAAAEGARLSSDDGPAVAPRARLRLSGMSAH